MVRASEDHVRVLVRRPHAYRFLNELFADEGGLQGATPSGGRTRDGSDLPIPGLFVLDADGALLRSTALRDIDEVLEMLKGPDDRQARGDAVPADAEHASLRVAGFTAAAGIT